MTKESLVERVAKTVFAMKKKLDSLYEVTKDVGMKLTHVIEYKFDYHTLPKGIDYEE